MTKNEKHIRDISRNRMKAHGSDYDSMLKLIPKHLRDQFVRDYVRFVVSYIPVRYRYHIVSHLKRRYSALVYYPTP